MDMLGMEQFEVDAADLPDLPTDEERDPVRQMAFQMTAEQIETVERAIKISKKLGDFDDTGNSNSNGNALHRIAEIFITQNGSAEDE